MTKDELQKLIDNFDIDKIFDRITDHKHRDNLKNTLELFQKKDYKSLLEELGVPYRYYTEFTEYIFYTYSATHSNGISIRCYFNDGENRLYYHIDDLDGIRKGVEFLRSLL